MWTIKNSDTEDWRKHSGYDQDGSVRGLAFAGEQYVTDSKGNSIVVLYNRAKRLDMFYQIVKHGTFEEVPVMVSFITTDIDVSQGVKTNLANLAQIVPEASGLAIKDGIIYDATPVERRRFGSYLSGSRDLPKGGYLGAGFLSHFDYTFYGPVPESIKKSFDYANTVRYDIFGSSLQAKMTTKILPHIQVNIQDTSGATIKASQFYKGLKTGRYQIPVPRIAGHVFKHHRQEQTGKATILHLVYDKTYQASFRYLDESGKSLLPGETVEVRAGTIVDKRPPVLAGYEQPAALMYGAAKNRRHDFIYKEKPIPKEVIFHYVDDRGKKLFPTERVTGYVGKKLSKTPTSQKGYHTPSAFSEVITKSKEHTFTYQKIRYPRQIRFSFVDERGRALRPDYIMTRKDDELVNFTPPALKDYRLPAKVSFVVTENATHRFVYQYVGPVAVGKTWNQPSKSFHVSGISKSTTGSKRKIYTPSRVVKQVTPLPPAPSPRINYQAQPSWQGNQGNRVYVLGKPQATKPTPSPVKKALPAVPESLWGKNINHQVYNAISKNTGMTPNDAKSFVEHLRHVARVTREKHKGSKDIQGRVNHAVANAMARKIYGKKWDQNAVNDFGEKIVGPSLGEFEKLMSKSYENLLQVDFPHFGMALATYEKSSFLKEFVKSGMSMPDNALYLLKYSNQDRFFLLNSYIGDKITNLDTIDLHSDMDAAIMLYHPSLKGLSLEEKIIQYYSTPNIQKKRSQMYAETIPVVTKGNHSSPQIFLNEMSKTLVTGTFVISLAAAGAWLLRKASGIGKSILGMAKKSYSFVHKKVIQPIKALPKKLYNAGRQAGKQVKRQFTSTMKYIGKQTSKVIKGIVKPLKQAPRRIYPPIRRVAKPITRTLKKVVRPIARSIRRVTRPVSRPIARAVNRAVAPIRKVFRPTPKRVSVKRGRKR